MADAFTERSSGGRSTPRRRRCRHPAPHRDEPDHLPRSGCGHRRHRRRRPTGQLRRGHSVLRGRARSVGERDPRPPWSTESPEGPTPFFVDPPNDLPTTAASTHRCDGAWCWREPVFHAGRLHRLGPPPSRTGATSAQDPGLNARRVTDIVAEGLRLPMGRSLGFFSRAAFAMRRSRHHRRQFASARRCGGRSTGAGRGRTRAAAQIRRLAARYGPAAPEGGHGRGAGVGRPRATRGLGSCRRDTGHRGAAGPARPARRG